MLHAVPAHAASAFLYCPKKNNSTSYIIGAASVVSAHGTCSSFFYNETIFATVQTGTLTWSPARTQPAVAASRYLQPADASCPRVSDRTGAPVSHAPAVRRNRIDASSPTHP
jgi:hypothetical protein